MHDLYGPLLEIPGSDQPGPPMPTWLKVALYAPIATLVTWLTAASIGYSSTPLFLIGMVLALLVPIALVSYIAIRVTARVLSGLFRRARRSGSLLSI